MQKLETRNTYTPTNTSLVRGNCDYALNREQHPSVHSLKTVSNNSEENQRQHTGGLKVNVYVINKNGKTLMPCKPTKARHLLEDKKAKVVSRKPFTIQLLWDCENNTQPITLGVDAGYQFVGFSATTEKKELISGQVELRTDISKKILEKLMYRRNRRNRLWYRQPRFNNRKCEKDWLAPSIKHKLDSHIRLVEKLKKLLPISKITVEVASFDIQKIKNSDIEGTGYQQGEQLGFYNIREYVLHRDNHTCQHPNCKHKKNNVLVVHHINGKAENGATNRPEELITVHKKCHDEHHAGKNTIPKVKVKQFKPETFITMVRWKIVNTLREQYPDIIVEHTYGYITKNNRIKNNLTKAHVNDAFVIAEGNVQKRCIPFDVKQVRRNNRSIQLNRKGFKPAIRKQKYSLQPFDRVLHCGKEHMVKGVHCKGTRVIISDLIKNVSISIKKVELLIYGKGLQFLHPIN
jgi:hypothetical protein